MSCHQEVENLPKLNELLPDADRTIQINYSGIPMTKQVSEELEKTKEKGKMKLRLYIRKMSLAVKHMST